MDTSNPPINGSTSSTVSVSSDSYLSSDEEPANTSFQYLSNSLAHGLDSLELDKSLVLQAQLSGSLNNESQKIIEKRKLLQKKLQDLQQLYNDTFPQLTQMAHDIKILEQRLSILHHGQKKLMYTKPGVLQKYPVEYNRAKDKVIERQLDI